MKERTRGRRREEVDAGTLLGAEQLKIPREIEVPDGDKEIGDLGLGPCNSAGSGEERETTIRNAQPAGYKRLLRGHRTLLKGHRTRPVTTELKHKEPRRTSEHLTMATGRWTGVRCLRASQGEPPDAPHQTRSGHCVRVR